MSAPASPARHSAVACSIALLVALLLAWLCSDVVAGFFPYAEEWKIMRPSLPGLAHPLDWFLGFAKIGADPYPAWSVAAINFWRPVMPAAYWLRGALFGEHWGAYLYFNFACLGMAAGALYLCLRTLKPTALAGAQPTPDSSVALPGAWLAFVLVGLFILMPPMVSATSGFLPILVPQFAFGRLVAALGLLAALAFVHRRYWLVTLLLAAALLTKEQALPMAIACPLTYAWMHRRTLRNNWLTLLWLTAPLLVWIGIRLLLFGSISQGVYVLAGGSASAIRSLITSLLKLPLYAPSLSGALRDPVSVAALLVLCNGLVLAYLALDTLKRWWHYGPEVISVAFIGYWGFLALVDLNPRYGALIIALAIIMLARRAAPGVPRSARVLALAALTITGLTHGALSLRSYSTQVAFSKIIYQVGRDYAAALGEAGPNTAAVVVLNDPNTVYTAPSDMSKVLGLPVTTIYKTSDYPWQWPAPYATAIPKQPCTVSVTTPNAATVVLQQNCGLQIAGALVPHQNPPVLPIADGIEAVYPQAQYNPAGYVSNLGQRLVLHIRRPGVRVLYFDPATRSFHWLQRAADAQNTQAHRP